jgi:hypothetical protein
MWEYDIFFLGCYKTKFYFYSKFNFIELKPLLWFLFIFQEAALRFAPDKKGGSI